MLKHKMISSTVSYRVKDADAGISSQHEHTMPYMCFSTVTHLDILLLIKTALPTRYSAQEITNIYTGYLPYTTPHNLAHPHPRKTPTPAPPPTWATKWYPQTALNHATTAAPPKSPPSPSAPPPPHLPRPPR